MILAYLFEIHVIREFHVLGVDPENFKTAGGVRNANVDFTIETAETSESRVDGVRTIGGGHDDDIGAGLETIHQGKQLRNDTAFDLAVCLQKKI